MYTHSLSDRQARQQSYINDKAVATMLAPNITRTHKTLDVGEKGAHAFYNSMIELSVSMTHPLFTSAPLRELKPLAWSDARDVDEQWRQLWDALVDVGYVFMSDLHLPV